jgi:hypothetical protein
MQTVTRKGAGAETGISTEPGALVAGLTVVQPVVTVDGLEGCAWQADAGEAPAAVARASDEERRSELDERILAGLLHA